MRFKQRFERVQKGVELTRVACDLCGKNVDGGRGFYDQTEVEIQAAIGKVYPEGDQRERVWIDCCPACFEQKVMPAIEALGVKFHREEVEKSIGADDPYPDAQWETATSGAAAVVADLRAFVADRATVMQAKVDAAGGDVGAVLADAARDAGFGAGERIVVVHKPKGEQR